MLSYEINFTCDVYLQNIFIFTFINYMTHEIGISGRTIMFYFKDELPSTLGIYILCHKEHPDSESKVADHSVIPCGI